MKKLLIGILTVLMFVGVAIAGEDTSGLGYVTVANMAAYTNNTMYNIAEGAATTNSVDLAGYKGIARLVIMKTADLTGVAITNGSISLQSAASPTGTYSTVTGITWTLGASTTASNRTIQVPLDICKRYPRIKVILLGTNAVQQQVGAMLVLPRLSE
jgi:hypothetical protein